MSIPKDRVRELSYSAPLISNIRQILTGLQGFDSMAREIIQNADDAGAKNIRFDITDDALVVWNDAGFLSCGLNSDECPWTREGNPQLGKRKACDFHAISKVGSGNKYNQPGLIGRFGIGFVSVYQLTDQPIIRSGDVELTLDPLSEKNQIRTIDSIDGSEIWMPWALDDRSPIREALNASAFSSESLGALQADLVTTAEDCLLFLKNLETIEVLRNGTRVSFVAKSVEGKNHVDLFFEQKDRREKWYVIRLDAEEAARPLKERFVAIERLDRQTAAQIAFRIDDHGERIGRLFAYLPTEQDAPVPCHINADFFPEQTRKALVLSGEQHERHWNQMLLEYVAKEIAGRLEELREVLDPKGLWNVIDEAYQNRNDVHFGVFWKEISAAARDAEVYWTSSQCWAHRLDCVILPSGYGIEHEKALEEIGIVPINSSMRPFKSSMTEIGVSVLTFGDMVSALKSWDVSSLGDEAKRNWPSLQETLAPISQILDDFLRTTSSEGSEKKIRIIGRKERELRGHINELLKLRVAPRSDGRLFSLKDLRRLPVQAKPEHVITFFPDVPLVHADFSRYSRLLSLVPLFRFADLMNHLADQVTDDDAAVSLVSRDKQRARAFYDFLADYPRDEDVDYSHAVASAPFLAGHGRFLSPSVAVLPGGFDDPIGRFDTLDLEFFGDRARSFLKEVLKVKTLTLDAYVKDHLADILNEELSNEQYVALLDVLVSKKDMLEKEGMRETLSALPLVRTKDGCLKAARDCYVKTDALTEILGYDDGFWVDQSIFSESRTELYLGFFRSLGMRGKPSLEHALDRIETIVEKPPSEKTRSAISKIFVFLLEVFQEEDLAEKEQEFEDEISRMRHMDWLPGEKEGKLDTEYWYAPHELYQPFRAGGFSSQVVVLSVTGTGRRLSRDFLEFLEMPAEPATSTIVKHLEDCIERGLEPSKHTYQILSERLKKKDDTFVIERLKDQECVYAPNKKAFISTDRFFWSKPNLPRYCFKAPEWMHECKELFDFLGVAEEPSTETYIDVLIDITSEFGGIASGLPGETALVHELCIKTLSEHLRDDPEETSRHLGSLREQPFLSTLAGTLAFVDEVAVQDSDWLAEPFGGELDARLVRSSPETADLIEWFKIRPLSSVTHLETVALGEVIDDEDATKLVRDRSDLLGWLCSDLRTETRRRLEKTLREIELLRTDILTVRSVFRLDDVPFASPPRDEEVVFDADKAKVYVLLDLQDSYWIPAFRSIFSTLLAGESKADIGKFALSADTVLSASSREDAIFKLRQAGYEAIETEILPIDELPEDDVGELDFGGEPEGAQPDWNVDDEEVIDDTEHSTERSASDTHIAEEAQKQAEGTSSSSSGGAGSKDRDGRSGSSSNIQSDSETGADFKDEESQKPARKARTEWMRSYVKPELGDTREAGRSSGQSSERISAIDEAAMNAVMDYERNREFVPERQPHYNPGYDVLSRSKKGDEKRLIEVKGLDGEWTERGVKLSRTQVSFAQDHPEEAWLYVVEHALEPRKRKINAIKNPFFKADEFWFDRVWRKVADEKGGDYRAQFVTGRRIQVDGFGVGTIVDIKKIGVMTQLKIEFRDWGTRSIAFNATTMELLEE